MKECETKTYTLFLNKFNKGDKVKDLYQGFSTDHSKAKPGQT